MLAIWRAAVAAAAVLVLTPHTPAAPADPIRIGFSMAMTGGVAQNGKQLLIALQLWRDDVNAKGGLLGRPVEFVYYDDQSNPNNVPAIYTKLITVDKVDLLLGPYATNMAAAAMPVIVENNKLTVSLMAVSINRHFNYQRYFSMLSLGPDGVRAFSKGFFDLAAEQKPKPETVAMLSGDAEFARTSADGARANAAANGFKIVYDKSYPPATTDFAPTVRAIQAVNPDIVFVAAYPPDTVGIVRAADEIGLRPKMFGGTMIGLLITPIKMQLGPILDGLVIMESFVPAPTFNFPGLADVLKRYRAVAAGEKIDPLGYGFVPFGYAAGQVLAQAVEGTHSLDQDKLAEYLHSHEFSTVAGEVEFGADGEWTRGRTVFTQFQHVAPDNFEQFADGKVQPVLWPPEYKTGDIVYPYTDAKK
ncbi:MAG TPA: amino acid ABC transporter substrate-binding protein [Xanthobacteraceae bacterium]|nr:amino acid ABC transporter substrate-binding protein [Xanthobacteraceae bacterium]